MDQSVHRLDGSADRAALRRPNQGRHPEETAGQTQQLIPVHQSSQSKLMFQRRVHLMLVRKWCAPLYKDYGIPPPWTGLVLWLVLVGTGSSPVTSEHFILESHVYLLCSSFPAAVNLCGLFHMKHLQIKNTWWDFCRWVSSPASSLNLEPEVRILYSSTVTE